MAHPGWLVSPPGSGEPEILRALQKFSADFITGKRPEGLLHFERSSTKMGSHQVDLCTQSCVSMVDSISQAAATAHTASSLLLPAALTSGKDCKE